MQLQNQKSLLQVHPKPFSQKSSLDRDRPICQLLCYPLNRNAQKIFIEVGNTCLQPDTSSWADLAGYTCQLSPWVVTECAQHGPYRRKKALAEVSYFREMPQLGQLKSLQMDSDSSSPSRGSFAPVLNCFHIIICVFAMPWAHRYFFLRILGMTSKIYIHLARCHFYLFLALL